jgi:hypothetical protein
MRRLTKIALPFFVVFSISSPAALAACRAGQTGTADCPTYIAPTTTAVPRASMDGSMSVQPDTSTVLFNGAVPPNGFMILLNSGADCYVNDNGPATGTADLVLSGGSYAGFKMTSSVLFVTPLGYKPMGPVSVWCHPSNSSSVYIAARGW